MNIGRRGWEGRRIERRALPHKRARAAAEYVGRANGNMAKAMRLAGYSEKTALHQATRLLDDPRMQAEIRRLTEAGGLSDVELVSKHAKLVNAERAVRTGEIIRMVPDNRTQLRAIELYYKLKGYLRTPRRDAKETAQYIVDGLFPIIWRYITTPEQQAQCANEIVSLLQSASRL